MAKRRRKKRNLNSQLKEHQDSLKNQNGLAERLEEESEGIEDSVVDQEAAPSISDELDASYKESSTEKVEGVDNTTAQADELLEGETLNQWQAEGDVEAETDAAVEDGSSDERHNEPAGVEDSVVDQEAAPDVSDLLHSDIPETKKDAAEGLENTSAQADDLLEGETLNQWEAEGDVEAQTDAAVADGKTEPSPAKTVGEEGENLDQSVAINQEEKGVKTSVIDQEAAPNVSDLLHSDIPETKKDAAEGLENTGAQADDLLEGETLNQWQAEGDVEAQTDAAVADGKTKPSPAKTVGEEGESLDQSVAISQEEKGVKTSVIDQEAAPNVSDLLHSDIPETKKDAAEGLENTSAQADEILEGETIVQWEAEYDVQAETDAAVADGKTEPSPAPTVGEEGENLDQSAAISQEEKGVKTSVIDQEAAPNVSDLLHSDIPETKEDASRGLENTSAQADEILEGETIVQWEAEYDVQAETDAAVADGKTEPSPAPTVGEEGENLDQSAAISQKEKGVKTSVIDQEAAPNVSDLLHSDIPETKEDASRGLENTSAQADEILEGETIVQWEAEYDVQAETDAAVADGKTEPSPAPTVGEEAEESASGSNSDDIPEEMKLSPDEVNKLFEVKEPEDEVVVEMDVENVVVEIEEPPTESENKRRNPLNHPIEKDLPIYLL